MFGGMNPKQMEALMKQMGVKTEHIEASEVVIRGPKNIVIKNPQVSMIEVKGQKTFQIMGDISEGEGSAAGAEAPEPAEIKESDIQLVADQAGVSPEKAREALKKAGGDIAEAILSFGKE
ncbi:MAG: nascent polypeptide-associated complex protein [Candidatus Micrarchaeota archaeon]